MKIKQLSVFIENRLGHLSHICGLLAQNNINIAALSLADTSEFGVLRLIVRDWEQAKTVLEAAGCTVNITDVVAIEVPDTSGGLQQVLKVTESANVSIEYMYAFTLRRGANAIAIISFSDNGQAVEALESAEVSGLSAAGFQ